jgi:hypothetical protein
MLHHEGATQENKDQETWPFTECKTWHDSSGTLGVVYVQVKRILDWETLALLTQDSKDEQQRGSPPNEVTLKVIMSQGPWCDDEVTMAWERYMQTEGLSQHVCCQHCDSKEKPIVVVTPGKMEQRRQLVCFCTYCWRFTSKHHSKDANMDMIFFRQFNPLTGKFHRALPYAEGEHPRRSADRSQTTSWINSAKTARAGHESILSLIQEPSSTNRSVPLLTRDEELGSRGTVHLRMLVPRGIAGVTEDDRATLQAWLELVDWTGLGITPKYPTPRRLKLNMDSTSIMHQWLTLQERQCGVHHHDAAQMFTDFRKELETLAKAIANQESNVVGRVEVMSGGAVLGTALIKWLKDGEEDIKVARAVVQAVWPRVCEGRSPVHSAWATSCETKGTHHCETTLRGGSSHNLVDHIRDGILSDGRAKHSCMYQGCEGRESL